MEYRTEKQFKKIAENWINGNNTDAAKQCEKYGFYANDLINYNEDLNLLKPYDIAILAEMAAEKRYKK